MTDTVVPLKRHADAVADLNDKMPGCTAWTATAALRWNGGVLEQKHQGSDGSTRWEPVPQAETMPQNGGKPQD